MGRPRTAEDWKKAREQLRVFQRLNSSWVVESAVEYHAGYYDEQPDLKEKLWNLLELTKSVLRHIDQVFKAMPTDPVDDVDGYKKELFALRKVLDDRMKVLMACSHDLSIIAKLPPN